MDTSSAAYFTLWGRAGEIPARYPAVQAPCGRAVTPRM
jgi:hypothetical protein